MHQVHETYDHGPAPRRRQLWIHGENQEQTQCKRSAPDTDSRRPHPSGGGRRRRYKRYRATASPLIGAERPSYARAHGVRTAPTHPAGTRQTGRPAPTPPVQGNGDRQIAREKQPAGQAPPPPAKGSGHIQGARGKPPAGQCTHVETTDDGVGHDVWPTNARETVTRPAPIVARVQSRCRKQPRIQPLDSQSGSNRAE